MNRRMIIVGADGARFRDIGDIDHTQPRLPAARPQLVALAQRVMQAVIHSRPGRLLAAGDMLARHPPARDLGRALRITQIVNDEDVAEIALHLGRDIGVALVHVEAVHADAARLLMHDQARLGGIRDIPHLESAFGIAAGQFGLQRRQSRLLDPEFGRQLFLRRLAPQRLLQFGARLEHALRRAHHAPVVVLDIGDHDVAGHAHLVRMRAVVFEFDLGHHARLARVRNIEDGGAVRRLHVAEKSMLALHHDLPATGNVEMAQPLNFMGERSGTLRWSVHIGNRDWGWFRETARGWSTGVGVDYRR